MLTTMPSGKSFYHRRPGRYAVQKKEFHGLIQRPKQLAIERQYTRRELANELGVSTACLNQWLTGQTTFSRPQSLERVKEFLAAH